MITTHQPNQPQILVVDDDPDVALLVKTVLQRRAGCIVDVAEDGQVAVERVAAVRPDVVVTDIEMPGLNGLELLAELRRTVPTVPVIVMTAHVSVEYAVSALRGQADDRIAATHGPALDRFQQKGIGTTVGELEIGRYRRIEVGDQRCRDDLWPAGIVTRGEGVEFG